MLFLCKRKFVSGELENWRGACGQPGEAKVDWSVTPVYQDTALGTQKMMMATFLCVTIMFWVTNKRVNSKLSLSEMPTSES